MTTTPFTHPLDAVPDGAVPHSVTATPVTIDQRCALRVSLTDEVTLHGVPGIDYIDQPTFLMLPVQFTDGTIEVDLRSRLNQHAPDYARGFAGIAYRISPDFDRFEAAYLRPLNGLRTNPPPPRDRRAVQHFTRPDWPFDRLRDAYPDGRYESGADIAPDQWIHLRLNIHDRQCLITVDTASVLNVETSTAQPAPGAIGLFVDIGTEAFFANLRVDVAP